MGSLIVLILRLAVPVSIFRWPLLGGLIALILDANDQNILSAFGVGNGSLGRLFLFRYEEIDKFLDMYYLSFEFIVSLRWKDSLAKTTSKILFIFRAIGFVLFEITGLRYVIFIFPNIFENFFIIYLFIKKFFANFRLTPKTLYIIMATAVVPKLIQEYMLHISQDLILYEDFKLWIMDLLR